MDTETQNVTLFVNKVFAGVTEVLEMSSVCLPRGKEDMETGKISCDGRG